MSPFLLAIGVNKKPSGSPSMVSWMVSVELSSENTAGGGGDSKIMDSGCRGHIWGHDGDVVFRPWPLALRATVRGGIDNLDLSIRGMGSSHLALCSLLSFSMVFLIRVSSRLREGGIEGDACMGLKEEM